jgi:p-hydroxybenzoate 3-monooxygenase
MTELLHVDRRPAPSEAGFRYRSQVGRLEYTTASRHAAAALAEQYAGLPF